jgi:hypothetical protein
MAMTELSGEIMTRETLRQELKTMLEQLDARGDGAAS